jgi:hypothetical protein
MERLDMLLGVAFLANLAPEDLADMEAWEAEMIWPTVVDEIGGTAVFWLGGASWEIDRETGQIVEAIYPLGY